MIQLARLAAIALTLSASAALACPEGKTGEKADCEHAKAATQSKAAFSAMHLNGAKKWTVDAHTKSAGAKLRATVEGLKHRKLEAYHGVAKQLDGHLTGLIQGCTMQGPDHDMLHTFLSEFMPAVQALGKAGNLKQAKVAFTTVQQGIAAFDAHFE